MTPNDERAQIRATGATSAHVGMTDAEQERARVVAWLRLVATACGPDKKTAQLTTLILAQQLERGDHLKGVE